MPICRCPLPYVAQRRRREALIVDAPRRLGSLRPEAHAAHGKATDDQLLFEERLRLQLDANALGGDDVATRVEWVGDREPAQLDRALALPHFKRGDVDLRAERFRRRLGRRLPDDSIAEEQPERRDEHEEQRQWHESLPANQPWPSGRLLIDGRRASSAARVAGLLARQVTPDGTRCRHCRPWRL